MLSIEEGLFVTTGSTVCDRRVGKPTSFWSAWSYKISSEHSWIALYHHAVAFETCEYVASTSSRDKKRLVSCTAVHVFRQG